MFDNYQYVNYKNAVSIMHLYTESSKSPETVIYLKNKAFLKKMFQAKVLRF